MTEFSTSQWGSKLATVERRDMPIALGLGIGGVLSAVGGLWLVIAKKPGDVAITQGIGLGFLGIGACFLIFTILFNPPWLVMARTHGIMYRCGSREYQIPWGEISELRVNVTPQGLMYYRLSARGLDRKLKFWLILGTDTSMIRTLEANVKALEYWKNRFQRA